MCWITPRQCQTNNHDYKCFYLLNTIDAQCLCLPCAVQCLDSTQNILVHIRHRVIPLEPLLTVHGPCLCQLVCTLYCYFLFFFFIWVLHPTLEEVMFNVQHRCSVSGCQKHKAYCVHINLSNHWPHFIWYQRYGLESRNLDSSQTKVTNLMNLDLTWQNQRRLATRLEL